MARCITIYEKSVIATNAARKIWKECKNSGTCPSGSQHDIHTALIAAEFTRKAAIAGDCELAEKQFKSYTRAAASYNRRIDAASKKKQLSMGKK